MLEFIPKHKSFIGLSFRKEVFDRVRATLRESHSDNLKGTYTPLIRMLESANGMTIKFSEIAKAALYIDNLCANHSIQTERFKAWYRAGHGPKWFFEPSFMELYESLYNTSNPCFVGLTGSASSPKDALSFLHTHDWLNNSWRRFYSTSNELMLLRHRPLADKEGCQNQFIEFSREAFNQITWYYNNMVENHQDDGCSDEDELGRMVISIRTRKIIGDNLWTILRNNTEYHRLYKVALDAVDMAGIEDKNMFWAEVFDMAHTFDCTKRKFSRRDNAINRTLELFYPIASMFSILYDFQNVSAHDVLGNSNDSVHRLGMTLDNMSQAINSGDLCYNPMKGWVGTRDYHELYNDFRPREYFWQSYTDDRQKLLAMYADRLASAKGVTFVELRGKDIAKAYLESSVDPDAPNGTLGGSCMRHENLNKCIHFYDNAGASLLVAYNEHAKVIGRAIIWRNARLQPHYKREIDREKPCEFVTFMDRIYYTHDYVLPLFIDHAKAHGMWRKARQSYEEQKSVISPDGKESAVRMGIVLPKSFDGLYQLMPFVDTFHYFDPINNILNNAKDSVCMSSYNDYNHKALGGMFRHEITKDGLVMKFSKSDKVKVLTSSEMESMLWNLRGTSMKPSRFYCKYSQSSSGSSTMTKLFGWVARPVRAWDMKGENIKAPATLSHYCSRSDRYYVNHTKVRNKWVKVPDEKFFINAGETISLAEGDYSNVPKIAVQYCPGLNQLVWKHNYGTGGVILRGKERQHCSRKYFDYAVIVDESDFRIYHDDEQWLQGKINRKALVYSNHLCAYLPIQDCVMVRSFGVLSKILLGAHAKSIIQRYQKLDHKIISSNTTAKTKLIQPEIPEEIQILLQ